MDYKSRASGEREETMSNGQPQYRAPFIIGGFIELTENQGGEKVLVKGSSITALRRIHAGATMVWFDTYNPAGTFVVTENREDILAAIIESYKQARAR